PVRAVGGDRPDGRRVLPGEQGRRPAPDPLRAVAHLRGGTQRRHPADEPLSRVVLAPSGLRAGSRGDRPPPQTGPRHAREPRILTQAWRYSPMADTVSPPVRYEDVAQLRSRISWGAIFAGMVVALACALILTLFFTGVGLSLTA